MRTIHPQRFWSPTEILVTHRDFGPHEDNPPTEPTDSHGLAEIVLLPCRACFNMRVLVLCRACFNLRGFASQAMHGTGP